MLEEIATEVGGEVKTLAQRPEAVVLRLSDGRVPLLGRGLGATVSVWCANGQSATSAQGPLEPQRIGAWVTAWAQQKSVSTVTILERMLDARETLEAAFGEPFAARITACPKPTEAWLHPPVFEAAAVGVLEGRYRVVVDGSTRHVSAGSRSELVEGRATLVDLVRSQRASYDRHRAQTDALRALADGLVTRLAARFEGAFAVHVAGPPASHIEPSRLNVAYDGRVIAELDVQGGRSHVVTQLRGETEHSVFDADLETTLEAIAAALQAEATLLTLDRLEPGKRYRVRASIQELAEGVIVTYRGFDDIDNHYGSHDFMSAEGKLVSVKGDYSVPHHHPFAATHHYLEAIESS